MKKNNGVPFPDFSAEQWTEDEEHNTQEDIKLGGSSKDCQRSELCIAQTKREAMGCKGDYDTRETYGMVKRL